ncbi:hypothetical protein ABZV91_06430 [Nocardia sp. NPDC004568]|uniref:hypothetical protein n=1 Tax=Nocardia sp. NPDC004568 TaxID=3154551 RepID=UPI0033A7CA96
MSTPDWADVGRYVVDHLVRDTEAGATLRANADAGLPAIDVSEAQGKCGGGDQRAQCGTGARDTGPWPGSWRVRRIRDM